MDDLSSELVELILQYVGQRDLKELTLVNRRFHALVNRILYRQLVISKKKKFHRLQKTLALYPDYGQHIQVAQFGSGVLTDDSWSTLTKLMPNLVTMTLVCDAAKLTDAIMAPLVDNCPHLGCLKLANADINALGALQNLHGLAQLELMACYPLDRRVLACLPPLLTMLTIERIYPTETIDILLEPIAKLCCLTTLIIKDYFYNVSDCLTMTWPQLTCLQLQPCSDLNDTITIGFIQRHPQLVKLVLGEAIFTDATLDAIATHLPGILHLGILVNTNITAHGVRRLVQRCTDLVRFELDDSNISVDDFPEYGGDPSHDTYVTYLDRRDITAIQLDPIN